MTNEEIETIMKSTFSGIDIFCRDLELEESIIDKYIPNQIIMERSFIDVSRKVGGLTNKCRYLIASAKARDFSFFSRLFNFGHKVLPSGSFFKVLDIQKFKGKTQIILLNIPQEGVQFFSSSKINREDVIIQKGREIFHLSINSNPILGMLSEDWIARTSSPIGMDKTGKFFLDTVANK